MTTPLSPCGCCCLANEHLPLVQVGGELNAGGPRRLHELLGSHLCTLEVLVLALSQVDFVGGAGLELLGHTYQRADSRGMQLRLVTGPRWRHRTLLAAEVTEDLPCYLCRGISCQ